MRCLDKQAASLVGRCRGRPDAVEPVVAVEEPVAAERLEPRDLCILPELALNRLFAAEAPLQRLGEAAARVAQQGRFPSELHRPVLV